MANTYYKLCKGNFGTNYFEEICSGYDKKLRESINYGLTEDLYSLVSGMNNRRCSDNIDMNTLLKYYIINKLMDTPVKTENNILNSLQCTSNPNIKRDKQGNFYRVSGDKAEKDSSITSVKQDGSYTVQEVRQYSPFKIIRTYNSDNQAIMTQIYNMNNDVISDKWQIAEILNLKQEFKTKYKYSGYSGNSKEVLAKVLNKFSKPLPTGYYMDFNCQVWKWSYNDSGFVRVFDRETELPLMSDLRFNNNGTVIRQEYTGIAS